MIAVEEKLNKLKEFYQENEARLLEEFFTFLSFKSISSERGYEQDIQQCCDWTKQLLESIDMEVEVWTGKGHPCLFAQDLSAGPSKPTLLIYHHYDVQPVDPIEKWDSPPFEPQIRMGNVYARGAQDNKGQCFYSLNSLKAYKKLFGHFPLNIKVLVEGEEECGSPLLFDLLQEKKQQLKADYLTIVDVLLKGPHQPTVTVGTRGILTMELTLTGSNTDLHSGLHGGIVYNPIHALVELLSRLRNDKGVIQVPGFYEDITGYTPSDLKSIDQEFKQKEYEDFYQTQATGGERQFSAYESNTIRPTLEINGISGGYAKEGFKTVIPGQANAKLSCRLVKGQKPEKIAQLISTFLEAHCPKGISLEFKTLEGGGEAVFTSPSCRSAQAASKALSRVFQTPCSLSLNGASLPIFSELEKISHSEGIAIGMGLDSDQIHAPNEHFGLDRLALGFLSIAAYIDELSQ